MIPFSITPEFAQRFAGSLIHFLWQGAVIAAGTAVLLRVLARKPAEWRYAVSCVALAAMLAAPMVTFVFYRFVGALSSRLLQAAGYALTQTSQAAASSTMAVAWTNWIVIFWFVGVLIGSGRMGLGWLATRRLLASPGEIVPEPVHQMFKAIGEWMAITGPVRLLIQKGVDVPSVVGWLRPVVLLPISAITRLDEHQLQAVLAHELAHIRRHDFLVNVVQRCVEAILFYHPAVWWLSSRVRIEREHCCDDLAVELCGDCLIYAEALLELERGRAVPAFSVAATGAGLTERIHRILGCHAVRYEWQSLVAVFVTIAAWILLGSSQANTVQAVPRIAEVPVSAAPAETQQTPETGPRVAPALGALAAIVTAQTLQNPVGASIEGVVVKAGSSEGIAGANVELTPLSANVGTVAPPKLVVSGPDGRFAFADLSQGGYRLVADLPLTEYQPGEYGQKTPRSRGTTIRLAAGQNLRNARIEMVRSGAVAGRITSGRGEPVARARVVAMEVTYRDGQPAFNILQAVQTDDLGQYRLFWLSPGKYYIGARTGDPTRKTIMVAMPAPGRAGTYEEVSSPVIRHRTSDAGEFEETDRMVYYGNTLDPLQSVAVDVPSGVTREGINVSVATGVTRALRVRGAVVNGTGNPMSQAASLRLIPQSWTPDAIVPNATTDAQGAFELLGVVPGSYVLYASATSPSGLLSGRLPVEVGNTDIEKMTITVAAGVEIGGRINVSGDASGVQLQTLRVSLVRDPDRLGLPQAASPGGRGAAGSNGAVSPDGSFKLTGVIVGDYRLNITGISKGTYIQAAQLEQENVLATGIHIDSAAPGSLQIRLGTDPGRIEGSTINDRREPASNAVIVLVPEAGLRRQKNLFKAVNSDLLGRFILDDVPPGNYKLFGWDHISEGTWENEAFLRNVESRGTPILVPAKATVTQNGLAVIP